LVPELVAELVELHANGGVVVAYHAEESTQMGFGCPYTTIEFVQEACEDLFVCKR